MNVTREIQRINEAELKLGGEIGSSWHDEYRDSAYIYIGNLPYNLNEGDLITVLSQFGEIIHLELARDEETGKSKGFAYVAYEDQRSTVLAVDNMNGGTLLGRTVRVDHKKDYKMHKTSEDRELDPIKLLEKRVKQEEEWRGTRAGPQAPSMVMNVDHADGQEEEEEEGVREVQLDLDADDLRRKYEEAKKRVLDVQQLQERKKDSDESVQVDRYRSRDDEKERERSKTKRRRGDVHRDHHSHHKHHHKHKKHGHRH